MTEILHGELSFCSCGSTESEGHTFRCIMEQHQRKLAERRDERSIIRPCTYPHCNCEVHCED